MKTGKLWILVFSNLTRSLDTNLGLINRRDTVKPANKITEHGFWGKPNINTKIFFFLIGDYVAACRKRK